MFFVFKAEAGKRNMGVPGVQTWALPICPSAILAEGWFANRHAKTAHGLIRYGRDEVVAVIDSTLAGRSVRDVMPELGRDTPIVGSLEEALEHSPTSILVGLAPAGGALPAAGVGGPHEGSPAGGGCGWGR